MNEINPAMALEIRTATNSSASTLFFRHFLTSTSIYLNNPVLTEIGDFSTVKKSSKNTPKNTKM